LDVLFGIRRQDAEKRQFADELIAYADAFTKALYSPLIAHAEMSEEAGKCSAFGSIDPSDSVNVAGLLKLCLLFHQLLLSINWKLR
jgi:hypothetical protein